MGINNNRQSIKPPTGQHSINHRPVWAWWEFEIESENALHDSLQFALWTQMASWVASWVASTFHLAN